MFLTHFNFFLSSFFRPDILELEQNAAIGAQIDKFSIKSSTLASRQSTLPRRSVIHMIEEEEFADPPQSSLARDNLAYFGDGPFVRVGNNELKYAAEFYGTPKMGKKKEVG